MRGAGLEPARYFYHEPLKLACLPFHHPRTFQTEASACLPAHYFLGAGADAGFGAGACVAGTFAAVVLPIGADCIGAGTRPSKRLPLTRRVDA